jgi:cohesin complex subunit SA-1/2
MNGFVTLTKGRDLNTRGSVSDNVLTGISNTVLRIVNLASISDCTEILEAIPAAPKPISKAAKAIVAATDAYTQPPIAFLIALVTCGVLQLDAAAAEDALANHALRAILPYFMWKISHWKTAILSSTPILDSDITSVMACFDDAKDSLIQVMDGRKGIDEIRIEANSMLCDLYCMFMVLKTRSANAKSRKRAKARAKLWRTARRLKKTD